MSHVYHPSDSFVTFPMEQHEFDGPHNQYLCSECHRPRCMHYRYPFSPYHDKQYSGMGHDIKFRGAHPGFTKPGCSRINEAVPVVPIRVKMEAERLRAKERERIAKSLANSKAMD